VPGGVTAIARRVAVVEDHVGGHALLLGGGATPGPQLLENRFLLGRRSAAASWASRQCRQPGPVPPVPRKGAPPWVTARPAAA